MSNKSLLSSLSLVVLLTSILSAQMVEYSAPASAPPGPTAPAAQGDQESASKMNELLGTPWERFARGWQYKYGYVEQPSLVSVGTGSSQKVIANPEHNLNQHSFTFDFSQVFPTSEQLAQAVQRYKSLHGNLPFRYSLKNASGTTIDIHRILEAGGVWRRALSGLSATASASEHGQVAQSEIVSPGYLFAGEVNFDPKSMLISGTDWKKVVTALKIKDGNEVSDCTSKGAIQNTSNESSQGQKDTASRVLNCYHILTTTKKRAFYALIPSFQYKRQTPFDFLKYGGGIIPSSTESGLNTWTVTVDVRRLIAGITPRLDGFEAADTLSKTTEPDPNMELKDKLCVVIVDGMRSYISMGKDRKPEWCQKLAKDLSAERYQLGCASETKAQMGKPVSLEEDAQAPDNDSCSWRPGQS